MTERRDVLVAELTADPYATGLLGELALIKLAQGEAVNGELRGLERLNPKLADLLGRLASQRVPLHAKGPVYFIGATPEIFRAAVTSAVEAVAAALAKPPPALLVEHTQQPGVPSFAHLVDEHFSYICFAAKVLEEDPAAILHEIAHAAIFTGNRYLDEGLACFLEIECGKGDWEAREQRVKAAAGAMPAARTLIAERHENDPYFERLGLVAAAHVHDHAALLVRQLAAVHGTTSLPALAARLRQATSSDDSASVIESFANHRLEDLDPLSESRAAEPPPRPPLALDAELAVLRSATLRFDMAAVDAVQQRIEAVAPLDDANLGETALEIWCRLLLHRLLGQLFRGFVDESEVNEVDAVVARFAAISRRTALISLFKALSGIPRIALAENQLAALSTMAQVRTAFQRAKRSNPCDVDVIFQHARFVMLTPEEHQVGKEGAVSDLRRLARHSVFGPDITIGIRKAGWEADVLTAPLPLASGTAG